MESWGIELKPEKPHRVRLQSDQKLYIAEATIGEGLGKEKSVIRVSGLGLGKEKRVIRVLVGDQRWRPVDLCQLLPSEKEVCFVDHILEGYDDTVEFSVSGARCIHLTGVLQTCGHDKGKQEDAEAESSISRRRERPRFSRMIHAARMGDTHELSALSERYPLTSYEELRAKMKNYSLE